MKFKLLALTFCLVAAAAATSDATRSARKSILAQYNAISKAFVADDFKAFASFMTDDFTAFPPKSKPVNKEFVVKAFEGERKKMLDVKWTKKIDKLELSGDAAHVLVEGKMVGKLDDGAVKLRSFNMHAVSEDDWIKVAGQWKLRTSKTSSFEFKIDGKPAELH